MSKAVIIRIVSRALGPTETRHSRRLPLVSKKHLELYCDEFACRYNTRDIEDGQRFGIFLTIANDRLRYCDLTL